MEKEHEYDPVVVEGGVEEEDEYEHGAEEIDQAPAGVVQGVEDGYGYEYGEKEIDQFHAPVDGVEEWPIQARGRAASVVEANEEEEEVRPRISKAKAQESIKSDWAFCETVVTDFAQNYANSNVCHYHRHEDQKTLRILYYVDGHELVIEMEETKAAFSRFTHLNGAITKLRTIRDYYNRTYDAEDFDLGDGTWYSQMPLGKYEDYEILIDLWMEIGELQWITWTDEVKDLEYGRVPKIMRSKQYHDLIKQFRAHFNNLKKISARGYQFQVLGPEDYTRSAIKSRLRSCMSWKVFKRAEGKIGVTDDDSFNTLFGALFASGQDL